MPGTDLPAHIGKYDVLGLIGRGAMGVVYRAYDPLLDRDVALKVMLPQIAGDPDQKARFEREARAVAKIVHPNVLTVFDLGYHHDGSPYIAMELLQGRDLLQRTREDPALTLTEKVSIVVQLLDGLAHAHQVGIVHRDIKPANIFLTADGGVRIMDFGVARFTMTSITEAGAVLGTADYMAPEHVQGGTVDQRSDLWSAGCVLHELLTGQRPFAGDSIMTVFYRITHDEPSPELPASAEYRPLRAVLRRALDKSPQQRHQTAAEFAGELREILQTLSASGPVVAARPLSTPAPPIAEAARHPAVPPVATAAPVPPAPVAPPPSAGLDPTPLFRLLRDIYVGARSGHLHFTHGRHFRGLFFLRGQILHATSDVDGEHLGDTLVRYGLISQHDLECATPIVLRDRKRLGSVLHERGAVDRARLEEAVRLHVRDLVFSVLDSAESTFTFEETSADAGDVGDLPAHVAPGEIILEAARRLQSPEVIRNGLGDLDRALALSSNPLLRVQKLTLSPTDGFLLSRVDGIMTAGEVFQIIPLPTEDVERSLFALLCTGTVEYLPRTVTSRARTTGAIPAAPSAADSPPRAATAPRASPPPPEAPPAPPPSTPTAGSDAGRQLEEERKRAVASTTDARRREVEAAFAGLNTHDHFEVLGIEREATEKEVKEAYFRLARKFHPDAALEASLADLRPKREAVFLRLGEACDTLRNPSARAHYERMLNARSPRRPPPPPPASDSTSPKTTKAGEPPPPPPPPETPPPPIDPKQRREATLEAVRKAMRLVREEKYWDAIQILEPELPELEGPVRHRALVTLARAYMKNPKWLHRAKETLQEVLQEAPEHIEAHLVLAAVYQASGLRSRAVGALRRVLELEPENEEARAELAAIESVPDTQPSPHILKRFFGRR